MNAMADLRFNWIRLARSGFAIGCTVIVMWVLGACEDKRQTTGRGDASAPASGPASTPPTASAPALAPTAAPVGNLSGMVSTDNAWCPIMPKKSIEPRMPQEWTREHEGKTIGLCCDECMAYWDTLDAEQRSDKLMGLMRAATP